MLTKIIHNGTFLLIILAHFVAILLCLTTVQSEHFTSTWTNQHRRIHSEQRLTTWSNNIDFNSNNRILDRSCQNIKLHNRVVLKFRGGSTDEVTSTNDEERYSRQVYTLGKQAHGLIRTATVYIDGPPQSGLVYECAKNLALSGIRHIILVTTSTSDNFDEKNAVETGEELWYHSPELDDLGRTYQRGAKAEIYGDSDTQVSDATLLVEYIRRLNPSVVVTQMERSTLADSITDDTTSNTVLLCIDRPISTAELLNHIARRYRWSFVATETAGVFGKVFCDFGTEFVVEDQDGETPLSTPLDHIDVKNVDHGNIIIHSVDGDRHDVSKGDQIQFQYRNGEKSTVSCTVVDVQTPYRFVAQLELGNKAESLDSIVTTMNKDVSSFTRLKSTAVISFDTIDSVSKLSHSKESMFTACDLDKSYDVQRRWASLSCFLALSDFIKKEKRLPSEVDKDYFMSRVKGAWPSTDFDDGATRHIDVFLRTCAAKFSPLQAVFGAIGSQEVLKAITKLYFPVHQYLLYDCDEIMSNREDWSRNAHQSDSQKGSPGLRYILGDVIVDKLHATKIFVVGSGAIGCEILKNLAAMGVGTMNEGKVVVTDMDTIEKSNLSRQLLFRDGDIGKFKSVAAREAVLRFCPFMQIEAHASKVGEAGNGDANPFDDSFWSSGVDVVLNALDNVEARLFMDRQCVTNKKALIDAGTMGPKGNVQVIVPDKSESYASSVDPPEPSIPLCTIKNFPYSIAHTIQWGRDLFEGLFQRRPQQANDFLDNLRNKSTEDVVAKFIEEKGAESAFEIAKELQEDLSMEIANAREDLQLQRGKALQWAIELALKFYYLEPQDLLKKHPLTSVDDEGLPFWSGSRRPPKSLIFNPTSAEVDQSAVNENFVEFVRNAAKLRIEALQDSVFFSFTAIEAHEACTAYFKDYKILPSEDEDNSIVSTQDIHNTQETLNKIVLSERRLKPIEFEKDDEQNGHVAFVNAASNLRAMVYGIPIVDAMETRRVAGKIVPAMISTTAFVSALSCTELVKVVQNVDLKRHRNAFINLALPFFAFTIPLPAEKLPGLNGNFYTIWDQLSITETKKSAVAGGITIKSLLRRIKKLVSKDPKNVNVVSISVGPYMLYANFLHDADDDVLLSSLWEQLTDAISSSDVFDEENSRGTIVSDTDVNVNDSYIDLTVVVEDAETGEEVELPSLRVHRFRQ